MVNYSRMKEKKFLKRRNNPLLVTKEKFGLIFLFFMAFLPAILSSPVHAFGKDKVAVLPFKIDSTDPPGNLDKALQEIFSQQMNKLGFQTVNIELINSVLGDNISYSDTEKEIIPFGKANNADWIIMGEVTEKEGSIQLNVKVLDPGSTKTPFSIMMIENDRKNLPEAIKKIAESLSDQIKNNIIISDIIVKGSKRASEDAILNIIESQKGDQFDPEKLDRDLRTIYKMGFFEDANYDVTDGPSGKIITFNLIEKPTIIKITFEGNKFKKDDKLMEELGIKRYSVLNRSEVRQSRNRLLEFYRNDGYYNVEIKPQVKVLPDENEVILNYAIDEGEKVFIKKIQFRGNEVFNDDDLKDIMLTKEKGWLSWFTDSGVLDKNKLEFDINRLRMFYDNAGYIKTTIGEPEITYDEKEEGLTLTIPVIEENQYKVNDIIVQGDLLR
ncbi:MAG: POTRA domain-containing protein, partial [Desulfobacteraceae bacterium]